jgi:hypothetical protein
MGKGKLVQVMLPVNVLLLFLFIASAWAIDHTVRVSNQSGSLVFQVQVWTFKGEMKSVQNLANGAGYTFHFGAKCPNMIAGDVQIPGLTFLVDKSDYVSGPINTRCLKSGDEITSGTCNNQVPNCKSSSWSIVKYGDGTYHFSAD